MKTTALGPVASAFFADNSLFAVIVGPVGSGKSTDCCLRLGRHAMEQYPAPDGIAYSRFIIARQTFPQLRDTTMATWMQVYPPDVYGELEMSNRRQVWDFKPKGLPHRIKAEFMFRAFDTEADVADLLSLEVTGFMFNEIREADEQIIRHAFGRLRYPAKANGGAKWQGIIGDSNPWHTQHYLHEMLVQAPQGSTLNPDYKLFRQPSALSPDAENIENLPEGYYQRLQKSYTDEDAKVYIQSEWGHTKAGKPIYTEYRDMLHCRDFELDPHFPLDIGMDFGRTPAAVIGQKNYAGAWKIRHEICTTDMGLVEFGRVLAAFLAEKFPGFKVGNVTGDPAGNAKDSRDHTAFDILKGSGIYARPARTNELSIRIEAVQGCLRRLSGGEPALTIHPDCKVLRTAMIDGYHYKKLSMVGERYGDEPDKNEYSHVAEALQYALLGGGEAAQVLGRSRGGRQLIRPAYAIT